MAVNAAGAWIGLGLGDVSASVEELKVFLIAKFSYAAPLQASIDAGGTAAQTYDATMVGVVTDMQTRYGDNSTVNPNLTISGVMGFSWQVRCGFVKAPKVVLFTAQGTGVDMWDAGWPQPYGIALAIAQAIPNMVTVQPIGDYPASVSGPPMGQSADMGQVELNRLMGNGAGPGPVYPSGPCAGFFYSQSAIFGSHWWRDDVLAPSGALHHRQGDVLFVITEGNPCRAADTAHGNADAGWGPSPMKDGAVTSGIAGPADCMTAAEAIAGIFYDYVWLGSDNGETELYTANPWQVAAGKVGTLIYNAVIEQSFGAVVSVIEALGEPIGAIQEIYNGLTFAIAGPNADHFDYDITPMVALAIRKIVAWNTAYVTSGGAITGSNPAA
jgi:hypothetical protein